MLNKRNRSANILLVDDDEDDQRSIRRSFHDAKIVNRLFIVNDGEEALDFLHNRGSFADQTKFPRPDLILLDLNMPKMDGREVLEEIRKTDELAIIPVIVLTTSDQDEDILRSYRLGCNSFISKPVNSDEFVRVVKTIETYWFEFVILPSSLSNLQPTA